MQLYQGAVGTIGLSEAQARASLDQQQRLSFKVGLAPDLRQGGSIRVSGLLPLLPVLPMVRLAPACSRHFPWHVPCQCIAFGCPPPPFLVQSIHECAIPGKSFVDLPGCPSCSSAGCAPFCACSTSSFCHPLQICCRA